MDPFPVGRYLVDTIPWGFFQPSRVFGHLPVRSLDQIDDRIPRPQSRMMVQLLIKLFRQLFESLFPGRRKRPFVQSRPLMTRHELIFFGRLCAALPEMHVCPQVAIGALLDPHKAIAHPRIRTRTRWMFSQKIADFVLIDRGGHAVLAIVELDDASHDVARDRERDLTLESAGYQVLRFEKATSWQASDLREAILGALPAVAAQVARR